MSSPNPTSTTQATGSTAYFQVTVDSSVSSGDVAATDQTVGDPDLAPNPLAKQFNCVTSGPALGGLTPSATQPVCGVINGGTPGTDHIVIWADKDGTHAYSGTQPHTTVTATFVGAPNSVQLTPSGTSTAAVNTCSIFTVTAKDANGQLEPNQAITVTATQSGGTPTNAGFTFCAPNSNGTPSDLQGTDTNPTAATVSGTVTTGSAGQAARFGVVTDSPGTITLTAAAGGGASAQDVITATANNVNAVNSVVITPGTTNAVVNTQQTLTVTVKDAANNPLYNIPVTYSVSGTPAVAAADGNGGTTNQNGQVTLQYTPTAVGTDTVTAWVNLSPGTTGLDPGEKSGTATINAGGAPTGLGIALTAHGTIAGGSVNAQNSTQAQNAIEPAGTSSSETFTAHVQKTSDSSPVSSQSVTFTIAGKYNGNLVDSANDATLTGGGTTAVVPTDANGNASVTLTDPNSVNNDAFHVNATIVGANPPASDDAYVLFQNSSAGQTAAPTVVNAAIGSSFPATSGKIAIAPKLVTTQVGTAQNFTSTVTDQFGATKAGVNTFYSVSGRNNISSTAPAASNRTTNAAGQSTFAYTDTGSTTSAAGTDTVTVVSDINGDGLNTAGQDVSDTATRLYTLTPPVAAAIDGGFGTPTEQFAAASPYAPVTSDDTATQSIDATHTRAAMTPVQVFFEVRNSDDTSHLPGSTVTISSSGVGSIVDSNNNPLTSPVTVTVAPNGFATVNVLSTATGTQTLTGTANGQTKTLTLNWTNSNAGRFLALTPSSATVTVGGAVPFTAKVTDLYGNVVSGQPVTLSLSGPGQFGNGTNSISGNTDSTGSFTANVTDLSAGTITITATASGAQFSAPANSPSQGNAAGNGTATATLTASAAPTPSATTTTLQTTVPSAAVNTYVTAIGTIKDANGNPLGGVPARIFVSGATTSASGNLTSQSDGRVSYTFSSANPGTVTVTLSVLNGSGVEQFNKTTTVTITSTTPATAPRPRLSQSNSNAVVTLLLQTQSRYANLKVVFYRRSGITGVVVPEGTCYVNGAGYCTRVLHQRHGQILAIYAKLLGATNIASPYSNDITFKIK